MVRVEPGGPLPPWLPPWGTPLPAPASGLSAWRGRGRPNAQAGKGRGGRVPGGSLEVNHSGLKLGRGLIDPFPSCTPGQARK